MTTPETLQPRRLRALAFLAAGTLLAAGPAQAISGMARGKVAVIESPGHLHAYSTYSGLWTSRPTPLPPSRLLASDFLGYVRAPNRVFCFNATNDRWIESAYTGFPLGESVDGATAVLWTTSQFLAISTVWTVWRSEATRLGEFIVGGGSAGSFGLVWTSQRALAYSASAGQWIVEPLSRPALGGLARNGLGLVWNADDALAFSPAKRDWTGLGLDAPTGVSATGDGLVGLIWSESEALAFSSSSNDWFPLAPADPIRGGSAGGEAALVWTDTEAHTFDASRSAWSSIVFPIASDAPEPPEGTLGQPGDGLLVGPNPSDGTRLTLRLPHGGSWRLSVFDAEGAKLAERDVHVPADGSGEISWTWREDRVAGTEDSLSAGTYWVRAESADRIEARRIVVLP